MGRCDHSLSLDATTMVSKSSPVIGESSARYPEIDPTDLLEMTENNQNNNTQRSTKTWVKAFDLFDICLVHLFLDAI